MTAWWQHASARKQESGNGWGGGKLQLLFKANHHVHKLINDIAIRINSKGPPWLRPSNNATPLWYIIQYSWLPISKINIHICHLYHLFQGSIHENHHSIIHTQYLCHLFQTELFPHVFYITHSHIYAWWWRKDLISEISLKYRLGESLSFNT